MGLLLFYLLIFCLFVGVGVIVWVCLGFFCLVFWAGLSVSVCGWFGYLFICLQVILFSQSCIILLLDHYREGVRCSSMVRAFTHGAMGRRIYPSWGGPIELFLVPASDPRLV